MSTTHRTPEAIVANVKVSKDTDSNAVQITKEIGAHMVIQPLEVAHKTITVGGNLIKSATDFISDKIVALESKVLKKMSVDPVEEQKVREQIKIDRDMAFFKAGMKLREQHNKIERFLASSKNELKKSVLKLEEATGLISEEEARDVSQQFNVGHYREQIQIILSKYGHGQEISDKDNDEIKRLKQLVIKAKASAGVIDTATAKEAFAI